MVAGLSLNFDTKARLPLCMAARLRGENNVSASAKVEGLLSRDLTSIIAKVEPFCATISNSAPTIRKLRLSMCHP